MIIINVINVTRRIVTIARIAGIMMMQRVMRDIARIAFIVWMLKIVVMGIVTKSNDNFLY